MNETMKSCAIKLMATCNDYTMLILRLVLGGVIFAHGAQKLFGIWGGHGMAWTVGAWKQWWNIPSVLTYSVIFIESLGALLLMLGLLTRVWAFLIGIIMMVAVHLVHLKWGFYMNWYMDPSRGEGFEYHVLTIAIVAALLIKGGGACSIDLYFHKKLSNQKTENEKS
jgi:putative oxidoreductase